MIKIINTLSSVLRRYVRELKTLQWVKYMMNKEVDQLENLIPKNIRLHCK